MNISKLENKECVSCRACEQCCPNRCISMHENVEGFLYPQVREDDCIDCGVCVLHCPVLTPLKLDWIVPERYAVILKDKVTLNKSSSGGLFGGIARYLIDTGGYVFGAAYDENLSVHHLCVTKNSDLEKTQGSKYVASDTKNTYSDVKSLLLNGQIVLYGGTPCQIAGLKAYLGKEFDNLYTMDLICHGVPSTKLFSKYLSWLGKKNKGKIVYYGFRDKDISGWSCGGKTLVKTKTKTKTKTIEGICDPYYASFLRCETYRESCYTCLFAHPKNRIGDITMGDFWGTDNVYPQIPTQDGISICSINTIQGKKLFSLVNQFFDTYAIPPEENLSVNVAYNQPSVRPMVRDFIYNGIDGDTEVFFQKFVRVSYLEFILRIKLSKFIPTPIKRGIKRLLKLTHR